VQEQACNDDEDPQPCSLPHCHRERLQSLTTARDGRCNC
jgi:hypothetical protein